MGRYQVLGTRLIFETFFWGSTPSLPPMDEKAGAMRTYMDPPKEILFEIDLVPGTWYLGKDLMLENPRAMWSGPVGMDMRSLALRSLALRSLALRSLAAFGGHTALSGDLF